MHYYQFNIGDYASHAQRLSPIEDVAYRRLLDLYYLNEQPFNDCSTDVARDIGMHEYIAEVEYILTKYFILSDGKWRQKRADKEIKAYQSKRESASRAGKASAKARQNKASEQPFNDCSTDVQPNIKHKPLTTKQEPVLKDLSQQVAPKFNFKKTLIDLGVDADVVDTWLSVRKKKRAVNSEIALKAILAEVSKAEIPLPEAIAISAAESWSGFKASWLNNDRQNGDSDKPHTTRQTTLEHDLTDRSWAN